MLKNKNHNKKEKRCRECFAYVAAGSRKCKFCGYTFKSTGKFIFDQLKRAFNVKRVFSVGAPSPFRTEKIFFTPHEIDFLLERNNIKILMYMILSDINYLDEAALIELGETLTSIDQA